MVDDCKDIRQALINLLLATVIRNVSAVAGKFVCEYCGKMSDSISHYDGCVYVIARKVAGLTDDDESQGY